MATGDLLFLQGIVVEWTASGGNLVIGLNSLASNVGRAGAQNDWRTSLKYPTHLELTYEVTMQANPAAGEFVECYWLSSYLTAKFAGNFTGADEAFTVAALRRQCLHVGNLVLDASTTLQRAKWTIVNPGGFGKPAVFNGSAQTFSTSANTSKCFAIPLTLQTQA